MASKLPSSSINRIVLTNSKYCMEGAVALRRVIEKDMPRDNSIRRYDMNSMMAATRQLCTGIYKKDLSGTNKITIPGY